MITSNSGFCSSMRLRSVSEISASVLLSGGDFIDLLKSSNILTESPLKKREKNKQK